MKSVLRTCLDPLPRFLSLRGLTLLVAMLVLGVVFSVWEFVESARLPEHRVLAQDNSSWSAPRCCARAAQSCGSAGASASCAPAPELNSAPAASQAQAGDPTPPSVFDPDRAATGG